MQDYHIYAHYVEEQPVTQTSPKFESKPKQTQAVKPKQKEIKKSKFKAISASKVESMALGAAFKINSYVGGLTENTLTQRRTQISLTAVGLAKLTAVNPVLGLAATATYIADMSIKYQTKIYKSNLSADYLRQLSGGTVSQR